MYKNILVCFQEIPDDSWLTILSVTETEAEKLKSFNGRYANADTEIGSEINDYFYTPEGQYRFSKIESALGAHTFDLVIRTGFLL